MYTPTLCIYHKDCVDGTAAAAVVLRTFPHAQCIPLSHRYAENEMDEILSNTTEHTHVYIVDATIGVDVFLARGYTVTVIDHHVSEHESMMALAREHNKLTYVYDVEKCGSSLTWSYLFPNEPLPELLRYVEDSDLWKQQYGSVTKDVAHYLSIWRNDPTKMLAMIEEGSDLPKTAGKIISEYTDKAIERLITIPPLSIQIGRHKVLAFNITDHESACGNMLATQHDATVALFTIMGSEVKLSFRSHSHHNPSSRMLAEFLGGGGHENAAGARVSAKQFLQMVIH